MKSKIFTTPLDSPDGVTLFSIFLKKLIDNLFLINVSAF